jgi:hypothetical protein
VVDDIDALTAELKSSSVTVEGIFERSYGREIILTDCNDYQIAVVD